MMHRLLFLSLCLSLFMTCENESEPASPSTDEDATTTATSFDEFLDEYHQERLFYYPLESTYAGELTYNHRLPNMITESYRDSLRAFYQNYQRQLQDFQRSALDDEQKISYDILEWETDLNLQQLSFPMHLMPINQFESLHLTIGQLAGGTSAQPFTSVKDYENWLSRLQTFTEWGDTAIVNMRKGIAQGYVLPKTLTLKLIPQMKDLAAGPVEEHLFYQPIVNIPVEFAVTEKTRLRNEYQEMIGEKIIPMFQKLQRFLEEEYLPASRSSSGISETPRGREYYDLQIKTFTTTNISADQIFALGKEEVARLRGEMEKVKAQVGFTGDLQAFFEHVRNKPELTPFDQPEAVIANFNAIHEKMKPQLEKLFDLTPKTAFEVRRTEAFREASASAEYMPGSTDGTRPGIFYVPIPDVKNYNIFSDEDLFLHEAIPGHHYQISLQQENKDLPEFRRTLWYSAYGEGWALYSESLGKELGLYTDPYQYFGMLSAEMHRAIRLVVDAGMHTKEWTREQAIQYSLENEAEPEASITAEIERYMSWPGQALSYKVGQLKIRELRAMAEQQLGEDFDIKVFHNIVLESGCVPLAVLEQKVQRWLQEERG